MMQLQATNYRVCQRMSLLLHHGQLHQCSETGSMLSYPVYKHYQVFLYLVKPIAIDESFEPSVELKNYIKHAKEKETNLMTTRKDAMSQLKWM